MSSSDDYGKSPLEVEFEAEIRYCSSDMRPLTNREPKIVRGITLQTTVSELLNMCDEQDILEIVIENEHSSKSLDPSLPLYHILQCGANVTTDQVPTIISVSVLLPGSVAQLKKYVVAITDELGRENKVELTSQDCILVDNRQTGYDSYVLLSNAGRQKLATLAPLNTEFHARSAPAARDWPASVGQVFATSLHLLFSTPSLLVRGAVHFATQGTFWRLVNISWVVIKLAIGVTVVGTSTQVSNVSGLRNFIADIFLGYIILGTMLGRDLWASLKELVENDLPASAQSSVLPVVQKGLSLSDAVQQKLESSIILLLRFLLQHERRGPLQLPGKSGPEGPLDPKRELRHYFCVALQDAILLVITLHPTVFLLCQQELKRQQELVEKLVRDQKEREHIDLSAQQE
ncbi:hypothetical protein KL930_000955 [Ogataea haglerorum]|uniref:Uncharacterized protein n=1 Tax=Ogataea haglerorum TaxID=1937702 RepID=A0ABQ7RND5_9ASCO|nr:hypothetical protein KL915_000956 [Ogataea haglerorum]KAG7769100.1 hypothetical protein KL946_000383 [Ogataea haglerorum]KAG7781241.1 hypothetical protein KL922_000163 [Ogataea haglerorum]KAG7782493.1 hypothetical protein KL930_000955 [Ogataea haglerorum]KAG7799824.1 hypothetical protein KL929_000740 [Ogataea haglerorum]